MIIVSFCTGLWPTVHDTVPSTHTQYGVKSLRQIVCISQLYNLSQSLHVEYFGLSTIHQFMLCGVACCLETSSCQNDNSPAHSPASSNRCGAHVYPSLSFGELLALECAVSKRSFPKRGLLRSSKSTSESVLGPHRDLHGGWICSGLDLKRGAVPK